MQSVWLRRPREGPTSSDSVRMACVNDFPFLRGQRHSKIMPPPTLSTHALAQAACTHENTQG